MNFASIGSQAASRRPSSTEDPNCPEAGFTLFETLTALLVLSIGLVSLFDAQSRALKTAGVSAEYVRARILAQNLLTETMGKPKPAEAAAGANGAFQWSVDVAPEEESWAQIPVRDNWKMFHVQVRVVMQDGRKIVLDSLKLGRSDG